MPPRGLKDVEEIALLADCGGVERKVAEIAVGGKIPHRSGDAMHGEVGAHPIDGKLRVAEKPRLIGQPKYLRKMI